MTVAYVVEQNSSVGREGERLVIKKQGALLHALHMFKLDQLVLFGNVFLTPAAIAYLLKQGADTVFMTRDGRYRGRLQAPEGKNITLRREQFRKMENEGFVLDTAKSIVAGKLANLRAVLLRLNRSRKGLDLDDHILKLKVLARKVPEAEDLDVLRGLEGRSAVLYFEGFSRGILAHGVKFVRRVRRPPRDPVNALLSLGYTLLFNTVMAAVSLVGFDPYLGCLHAVEYGRPSLALDLMEEWRPVIVDTLVLSVFNLKTLTLDDFVVKPEAREETPDIVSPPNETEEEEEATGADFSGGLPVRLTDSGFRKFLTQFERKVQQKITHHLTRQQLSYRDCVREQVRHFARYVRGEEKTYQPMPLR